MPSPSNMLAPNDQPVGPDYVSLLQGDEFNNLKSGANNKGMNPWALLAIAKSNRLGQRELEKAGMRGNRSIAEAEGNLASKGGLTSGARERLQQEGTSNYLNSAQGIGNQNALSELNIGLQDEAQKSDMKKNLLALTTEDTKSKNAFEENRYNQKMAAWAAEKQAEATANSGKK